MRLLKLILHYSRIDYTHSLVSQIPDCIVFDARGDYFSLCKEEVITIENKGFTKNWNTAIRKVWNRDWDWIWLANNDIVLKEPQTFFNYIQEAAAKDQNIKMISGAFNSKWENCQVRKTNKDFYYTHGVEFTAPFLHRSVFERFGLFPEEITNGFGIDLIYSDYFTQVGYSAVVVPQAEFYHYESVSGEEVFGTKEKYLEQGFSELFKYVDNYRKKMNRTEVLNTIIKERKYKTYCEIGYGFGDNFNKIECETKICVDPFQDNDILVKQTSSLFFDTTSFFFDIIFIDGDHRSAHVFTDYYFSLKRLNKGGIIAFHDVNPPTAWHVRDFSDFAAKGGEWCGDAYKGFIKATHTTSANFFTVGSDFGIGIIDFKKERNFEILPIPKSYEEFSRKRGEYLRLILPTELTKMLT
jgi:hypothetical protein